MDMTTRLLIATWGILGAYFIIRFTSGKHREEGDHAASSDDPPANQRRPESIAGKLDAIAAQYQSANTDEAEYKRKNLRWTRGTTVLIAAYTVLTIGILYVSRDQERRQLRAYIGPIGAQVGLHCLKCDVALKTVRLSDGIDNTVLIPLKNFGLTPAREVTLCAGFHDTKVNWTFRTSISDKRFMECERDDSVNRVGTIWPGDNVPVSVIVDYPDDFISASNVLTKLYFYGKIDYYDVFGEERASYFCFIYKLTKISDIKSIEQFLSCENPIGEDN